MAKAGEVVFEFKGDTSELEAKAEGLTKSITKGTLVTKAIEKAIGLVSSSLDGAIDRLDTFSSFPKVMEQFGVSADEASASIKRIEKGVLGLPTSLDQAVSSVKDLFTVTQDLEESEKLFLSINDAAMVFANGSTEAVSNFIYGYKQSLSNGKVAAQEFNQMNNAIPGLMSKVGEAIGVSYSELKSGLSDGTITIDQFNNALKKLDAEGVGSMNSLQSTAKTATSGIKTSITNMKTAVVRGVGEVISSIDKGLQSAGLGTLSENITKIGKGIESGLGVVAQVIPPAISFIAKFKKEIIATIGAIALFKTVSKGIGIGTNIYKMVQGLQSARVQLSLWKMANKKASAAQIIFNSDLSKTQKWLAILQKTGVASTFSRIGSSALQGSKGLLTFIARNKMLSFGMLGCVGAIALLGLALYKAGGDADAVANQITEFANKAAQMITTFANQLPQLINKLMPVITNIATTILPQLITTIVGTIPQVLPVVLNAVITIFNSIVGMLPTFIPALIDGVITIVLAIVDALPTIIMAIVDALPTIISSIVTGLLNCLPQLITGAIKLVFGIVKAIPRIIVSLIKAIPKIIVSLVKAILNSKEKMKTAGVKMIKELWKGFKSWIKNMWDKLKEFAKSLPQKIKSGFSKIGSIGKNLVTGLWNGIKEKIQWIKDKIKNFAKDVLGKLADFLGISSPSKYTYQMGVYIDEGMIEGVDSMQRQIQSAFQSIFDLSPNLYGTTSNHLSPTVNVYNNISYEQDPLGQMVKKVKTFSGGAKNDYNYGM